MRDLHKIRTGSLFFKLFLFLTDILKIRKLNS